MRRDDSYNAKWNPNIGNIISESEDPLPARDGLPEIHRGHGSRARGPGQGEDLHFEGLMKDK